MLPAMQVHRPGALGDALALLRDHGEDAKVLAGGTAFTLFHKMGLLDPEHVVTLRGLGELVGVRTDGDDLAIGAMTRLSDVERDPLVRRHLPVLAGTLRLVANLRVRNAATMGGNLVEADPSSDPPAVLVAAGAVARLQRADGARTVPLTGFFRGFLETEVADDELLTEVVVPSPAELGHGSYVKFLSRHTEDRTCLGAAAFVATGRKGRVTSVRVCVIGSDPVPLRLPDVEDDLVGRSLDRAAMEELAERYVAAAQPVSDHRGSASYRRRVMRPLIVEALERASAGDDTAVRW